MFNDLIELLLVKEGAAKQEYELAKAEFEQAAEVFKSKENTLDRINIMLDQCGYIKPQPQVEAELKQREELVAEQAAAYSTSTVY